MDSEDSRDASSGNGSDHEANSKSPSSRSSSDQDEHASARSRSNSANSNHSHKSTSSRRRRSSKSRSSSPDISPPASPAAERGRPRTPKSPDNVSVFSQRTTSPPSRNASPKSVDNRPASPSDSSVSRSPSLSSSRSQSPRSERAYSKSEKTNGLQNAEKTDQSPNDVDDRRSSRSKSPSVDRLSAASNKSASSRDSRRARQMADLEDGHTSDSSASSNASFKRKSKEVAKNPDTQPEEISDGDMESDNDKKSNASSNKSSKKTEVQPPPQNISMNHEDLSDVSDLDESIGGHSEDENLEEQASKLRQQIEEIHNPEFEQNMISEKTSRTEEGEEQLDFEAEDGECGEIEPSKEKDKEERADVSVKDDKELEEGEQYEHEREAEKKPKEELEEGEVTDEDDVRPEETEPRPVCRFFSRGQCTWGASCRFLHPGVTDKGNYTMFEMIRPVIPGEYARDERMFGGRVDPPPMESAWERGLRTAKEMVRKSLKRKEQDTDFEEKKMNLTLAQEEFDKENGYYLRPPSPESRYVSMRHPVPVDYPPPIRPPPEDYYGRRQVLYEPEYVAPPRERVRPYRELPSHRMPDYYSAKYEEEVAQKAKRPKREVIVQRVEERPARGDEWSDPWMRSKSPSARKGRKRSYSSGSSFSSSSSSRSSSASSRSSYRSRSRTPKKSHRSPRGHRSRISPSVIVSERKAAIERAALMNPPAPKKKAPSPGMMRAGAQNPPAPAKVDQFGRTRGKLVEALARVKARQRSSRSSSGSSASSSSDSDSSDSSSSSSRDNSPPRRTSGVQDLAMAALKAKAIDALKGSAAEKRQIKLNLKTPVGLGKADATQGSKKRPISPSALDPKSAANKKATSRREELLKQLKAVEDAIAKKRSKVN